MSSKPLLSFIRKLTNKEISKSRIFLDDGNPEKLDVMSYINCKVEILLNDKVYHGEIKSNEKIHYCFIEIPIKHELGNVNTETFHKKSNDLFGENDISEGDSIQIDIMEFDQTKLKVLITLTKV